MEPYQAIVGCLLLMKHERIARLSGRKPEPSDREAHDPGDEDDFDDQHERGRD